MAKISISDIKPAGTDLFTDSESYLRDLTDAEADLKGGWFTVATTIGLTISLIGVYSPL